MLSDKEQTILGQFGDKLVKDNDAPPELKQYMYNRMRDDPLASFEIFVIMAKDRSEKYSYKDAVFAGALMYATYIHMNEEEQAKALEML